jgi:Yip1-like protein
MTPTFLRRLFGAAMLDPGTYEEVEADRTATPQALTVVVFSSLAAAIGARGVNGGSATLAFFASASVIALLAWATWALVTFEIGGRLLPTPDTRVDPGELLRTLGFAAAPGLIQVFAVLPRMAVPVFVLAIVWALAASVVAVRQALDYTSTARALAVSSLGITLALAMAIVLGLVFAPAVSGL